MVRADFIRPLLGKRIAFHGRLRSLSPEQALQLAARFGGTCQSAVDASVDVVVLGGSGYSAAKDLPGFGPEAVTAGRMRVEGKLIQVLDEQEFLHLVVSPMSDA